MSESYSTVLNTLKKATSVLQASNIVLTKYEKPADTGTSVQTKRAGYGQAYYGKDVGTSYSASTGTTSSAATVTEQTATAPAKSFNKSLAGTCKTTGNLCMRNDAGQGKAAMVVLPKETSVKNYGYYTSVSGTKWLYVPVTYNNIKYTGFCCETYLKKQ